MIEKHKIRVRIKYIIILVIILTLSFLWGNNHIVITEHIYKDEKIPAGFNNYKILQISDLHNKSFGKNQKYLLEKVNEISPDIILITGDLIDRRKYDLETSLLLIEEAIKIAPIYYASGNHEAGSGDYDNIRSRLIDYGVVVLDNEKIELIKDNEEIEILGLSDPAFSYSYDFKNSHTMELEDYLKLMKDNNKFQILLAHRPELIDIYAAENIDMIFSGHAHGGQIRLPLIGGLFAPGQGFLPKYTSGLYNVKNSNMFVSRGLGNSIAPIRIFNQPELLVVKLFNN